MAKQAILMPTRLLIYALFTIPSLILAGAGYLLVFRWRWMKPDQFVMLLAYILLPLLILAIVTFLSYSWAEH